MMRKITLILLVCSVGLSCGKKIDDSPGGTGGGGDRDTRDDRVSDTLKRFIEKQTHECEDELHCNESVAKLVVVDRQNVRYCTATLIGKDVLLTSSSCLPKTLRVPSLNCAANIFAIFPKTTFHNKEIVNCNKIVSSDTNEEGDPALWNSDFAFIKLAKKVSRKTIKVSRKGMKEDIPYRFYKVDLENDYDASQKLEYCYPVYDTYANPFSSNRFSPLVTVRDCISETGNSGAPLIDFNEEIVGVFSGKLDKGVGTFITNTNLMIEPMAPIHHVANTACVRTPRMFNTSGLNPECRKGISTALLDRYRDQLLNSKKIHAKNMNDIKDELETPEKYFKWKVSFLMDSKGKSYEPHFGKPRCFFDIKSWIDEFKRVGGRIRSWSTIEVDVPNFRLETKLDRKLKPISFVADKGSKKYKVSFNPRYAFFQRNTNVVINSTFDGRQLNQRFESVTDSCSNYWD